MSIEERVAKLSVEDNDEEPAKYFAVSTLDPKKNDKYKLSNVSSEKHVLRMVFSKPQPMVLYAKYAKDRVLTGYTFKPSDFYLTHEGKLPNHPTKEEVDKHNDVYLAVIVARTTQDDYDKYLHDNDDGAGELSCNVLVHKAWTEHENKMVSDPEYVRLAPYKHSGLCSINYGMSYTYRNDDDDY